MGSSVILPVPGQPKTGPDPGFTSGSQANLVSFAFQGVGPPSPLYIQRDDILVVEVFSSVANEIAIITIRLLLPFQPFSGQPDVARPAGAAALPIIGPGTIVQGQHRVPILATFTDTVQQFALLEGYLLSVGCAANVTSSRGATFVRVWLNRASVSSTVPNAPLVLFSDYVTQLHPASWPTGRQIYPTEGPGNLIVETTGNPAAGVDWTITMPFGTRWRIQSWNAQLVTSAAVANRIVRSRVTNNPGAILWQGSPSAVIPASTTAQVSAASGQFTSTADATTVGLSLPSPLVLLPGGKFGVNTLNLQVGDQWSAIQVATEEWLDSL